ncbi:MAG: hypothetical protein IT440_14715, partial [Phycisphaeraceae bacterium]|nr:hypothetical protein [Phycisphaeraceae bacterium]
VMDIATGQVLAAVTIPGYTRLDLEEKPTAYWESPWSREHRPQLFRPVAMPYQPGSTMKPLILVAAYTDHKVGYGETIDCEGALDMSQPDRNRCWIFKHGMTGHGPLAGPEAIRRSCNVFFYTMGKRLGGQRLVTWFDRFGLGRDTECGLSPEHRGHIPDLAQANVPDAPGFGLQDAIQMGIGQGPVMWTPIQAACVFAAIARHGSWTQPTFLVEDQPSAARDLHLDPRGVDLVLQGLYESVNEASGTSNHLTKLDNEPVFNIPDLIIRGKSGTATPGARWFDRNQDRKVTADEVTREPSDHAWFVGIIQRKDSSVPNYVVVVVAEYAGSGGAVSGPIANQILYAMRAEGYL